MTAKTDTNPVNDQIVDYKYDYDIDPLTGLVYPEVNAGRLKEIITGPNTFTYDYTGVNSQIQKLTRPSGSFTDYIYSADLKRLTDIHNKDSVSATVSRNEFTYNDRDLIDLETITTGTALDAFTEGLTTYTNNDVNQLEATVNPANAYTYDDDGNMTQGYTPDGYVMTMTYDAENRLKTAEYTDGGGIVHRTEYSYSGDSFLVKVIKKLNGTPNSEVRFIRSGYLTVQERDSSNTVTREYTWGLNKGGGIGGLLSMKESGSDYYYLYDGKGNVMVVLDSNQDVKASYRYDVFGEPLKTVATLNQPFQFSTKRYDEQTGLSYYGYRFYSPAIGRWMSRDPLGEAGGINLYGFNNNNAINYIDPHGEVAIAVPVIYALAKAAIYTTSAIVGAVIGQAAWDTWFANDANTDDDGGESCDTRDKGPSGKPKVNVVDIHLERELKMLRVMRGKGTQ